MPAYIVATVDVSDPAAFANYTSAVAGLSATFGGETVLKGAVSEMLEGAVPDGQIVVVTRFADAARARAYVQSDAYQAAKQARIGAAHIDMRLIETA